MDFFLHYDWPGNVRELSNTLKRLMVLGDWDSIKSSIFPEPERTTIGADLAEEEPGYRSEYEDIVPLKLLKAKAADHIERRLIAHALSTTGGNKTKAAEMLNISYKALFYKMKNLGLR